MLINLELFKLMFKIQNFKMCRSETWKISKTIHNRLFLFLANFYCDWKKCLYLYFWWVWICQTAIQGFITPIYWACGKSVSMGWDGKSTKWISTTWNHLESISFPKDLKEITTQKMSAMDKINLKRYIPLRCS